jgi:CotH kinase protein/Concanavalin A-like lectin/glucanases superfamily/Lamin Tail Domain
VRILPILPALAAITLLSSRLDAQVIISEFVASNIEGILDDDGNHEDWIELKNAGVAAVDLSGWFLTDSSSQLRKWPLPAKVLQPGNYLLVFASNKDRRNPAAVLHTNFKLDGGGEYLALTRAEPGGGTTVVQSWSPYPPQAADVSYGLTEAGTLAPLVTATSAVKYRVPDATTGPAMGTTWRGANEPFSETGWTAGVAALGRAGIPNPAIVASADIQHRYNTTDNSLTYDTSGKTRLASSTTAAFLASATDTAAAPLKRTGVLNFVGSENDQFLIPANTAALNTAYNVASSTVCFWIKAGPPTGSGSSGAMLWDRRPNYTTPGIVIVQLDDGKIFLQSNNDYCSFGSPGSVSDNQWHHIAAAMNTGAGAAVTLYVDGVQVATANNSQAWGWTSNQPIELGRSHDTYWKKYTGLMDDIRFYSRVLTPAEIADIANGADSTNGTTLFSTTGVSAAEVTTTLPSSMVNAATGNPSVFVRIPFTVADPGAISGVMLTARQTDGYAAWINGIQIGTFNAPATPAWNSAALSARDPGRSHVTTLSTAAAGIHAGTNILAIQLLNNTTTEPNILLRPLLDSISALSGEAVYFVTATPGATNSAPLTALGPHISNTTKNPAPPAGGAGSPPLTITTKVQKRLDNVSTVQLAYRIMWSAETLVPMLDNGVAPDALAGDKVFTAQIPTTGLSAGQMLRWRIVATDTASSVSTDPLFIDLDGVAGPDTDQYYGTIAPDAGYTTGLPVLHWFVQDPNQANTVSPGSRCSVFFLGRFYDYVFVNLHGQSTQGFPKKSYNLGFNKDNRFKWKEGETAIRSVNFLSNYADKSKLRNTLAYAAWADSGHAASHFSQQLHVRRATGTAPTMTFYTLYDMVEDGNEEFLARCGLDGEGALYKMYNSLEGANPPGAEKKTREFEDNSDLVALVNGINSGRTAAQRRQYLYDNVHVPTLINFCVVHSLICNTDWGHKNYYVYRDSHGTGEWYTLPWDQDLSFGHSWWGAQNYFDDEIHSQGGLPIGGGGNHLMQLVYNVPELNEMFVRRFRTLRDQIYVSATETNGPWEQRVTSLINLIDPSSGPTPVEVTLIDGTSAPCKWLVPAGGNGGFTLTAGAGAQQWTNYTDPPNIANWTDGTTGVGYDNNPDYLPLIGSNTGAQMFNINATCYVRVTFNIPDAATLADIGSLTLGMKYEDGFRAYVNGTPVAGRNDTDPSMTNDPSTAVATTTRDEALAVQFESMDITAAALPVLRVGTNVLAIHCLNSPASSSDLLMVPKLTYLPPPPPGVSYTTDADRELQAWGFWVDGNATQQFGGTLDAAIHPHGARLQAMRILNSNPNPPQTSQVSGHESGNSTFPFLTGRRSFLFNANPTSNGLGFPAAQPASPALVIEQVDFNPISGNQDEEYFVIRNGSGASVDLSGWKITGAVGFTFPAGTVVPAFTGVENIGLLHVAKSPSAFRVRTTGATGGQYRLVVGPYSGSMSARGETIELRRPDNSLLTTQSWTPAPTPAQNQLRVSEINYAPSAPTPAEQTAIPGVSASDFEYLELVNTGATALNLGGARFTKGIEFTFPLGTTLAAGARVVLVSNHPAFTHRYGGGATVGGQYLGNLNNAGDTLQIVDSVGEEVLEFRYEPDWYPQSDGGGHSLVTRSATPGWADYGTPNAPLPAAWALSVAGGTPGTNDTDFANGYEGWRFNHWTLAEIETPGAPVLPGDNADLDPMSNFAEYCFGKNPRIGDATALSSAVVVNVAGTNYGAITFTRRHLAVDVTWAVQESTDLTAWNTTTVHVSTTQLGNGLEQVTYRSATAGSPRFFQVVATKQ